MTALVTKSTARKRYRCSWDCGSAIEVGQPYVRWALPPWTELNEQDGWQVGAAHGEHTTDCPTFIDGIPDPVMDEITEAAWRREQSIR